MEIFQDVLKGFYPFLLIFQLLIVSGLLLTLIWFVIQRAREGAVDAMASVPQTGATTTAQATAASAGAEVQTPVAMGEPVLDAAPVAAGEPMPSFGESLPPAGVTPANSSAGTGAVSAAPNAPARDESKLQAELLAKEAELKTVADEGTALKDKIRYLESRLMEYEIVQEEISALSQLRVENEKLKEDLLKFQGGKKPEAAAAAAPSTDPAAAAAPGAPAADANPLLGSVSQGQIDNILSKLDEIGGENKS